MIYALTMSCKRDSDLCDLMHRTLKKHCPDSLARTVMTDEIYPEYKNGAGWNASMIKLKEIGKYLDDHDIKDSDYILSVDSDVIFCSPEVFSYASGHGIIGIKHQQPFPTRFGAWGHMSGALIFIRGSIARKITALTEQELVMIRFNHFKAFDITENEDVVLSYLCRYVEASDSSLPGVLTGDFESDIKADELQSFYHLNYCPTEFLGEQVTGKWDIPNVLKQKQIEL